jgi:hypothetical protein
MKRVALLALLMMLAGAAPADAAWPCWVVQKYAAARGLGPPLTPAKQKRLDALAAEHNVSAEDQRVYAACFKAKDDESKVQQGAAQGAKAQKRGRMGRRHR